MFTSALMCEEYRLGSVRISWLALWWKHSYTTTDSARSLTTCGEEEVMSRAELLLFLIKVIA